MVTITRREGHWGAILSRDGRWLTAEKMIERGQWFVLQGEREISEVRLGREQQMKDRK
jgi:hypothetical protein